MTTTKKATPKESRAERQEKLIDRAIFNALLDLAPLDQSFDKISRVMTRRVLRAIKEAR